MDVGFYGKLPSHGDFLRRRVSDAFVDGWDHWLGGGLTASRSALGPRWLDVYLTSPAWRFACGAGACGPAPVIGLMAPSVDRVGRYFPLTLIAELPAHASLLTAATQSVDFFEAAERLVIETLAAEAVDFERFDQRVIGLAEELGTVSLPPRVRLDPAAVALFGAAGPAWQMPIESSERLTAVFEQLLTLHLAAVYDPLVLWWTEGSAMVDPSCLITKGLPPPETFAALLDGAWQQRQWRSIPVSVEAGPDPNGTVIETPPAFRFRSAAATDVGRAREINEDGFIERPEVGVWVVADGLGGHTDGEVASRMVCDALADFDPQPSFDDTVAAARRRIEQVNDHLLRISAGSATGERSGSTVVALLVRDGRCAILWAGDSRVYRWRAGKLEQLTRDHSLATLEGLVNVSESHVVTRAVGVQSALTLDLYRDEVCAADRYLLCSDGLTRVLSQDQIVALMDRPDIRATVTELIEATLAAGAPDNVTVLVVEAAL